MLIDAKYFFIAPIPFTLRDALRLGPPIRVQQAAHVVALAVSLGCALTRRV